MLYRTLKRLIELGRTEGMKEKLDIFLATGSLTVEQHSELSGMLPN